MNVILLDIGNSRIKIATGKFDKISPVKSYNYSKATFKKDILTILDSYKKTIRKGNYPELASVSLNDNGLKIILKDSLKKKFGLETLFVNTSIALPIKIDYEKTLGADRICSSTGAVFLFGKDKNLLVIDYGTATTFNLISKGVFKGGLISPGIGTSLRSLVSNSTLPYPKLDTKTDLISNKTLDNIKYGVINSAVFTTERVIAELKKRYRNLIVIATGGFSVIIKKNTNVIDFYSDKLVLEGLNQITRI